MQYSGLYNYWIVIVLMMTGLYMVIAQGNLVKKLIGLNIFQVSVFMLYITMGKIDDGTAPIFKMQLRSESAVPYIPPRRARPRHVKGRKVPILPSGKVPKQKFKIVKRPQLRGVVYSNPVPHVLILTAIVVGIATTSLGLALVVRIHEAYGSIEEDEIQQQDEEP